MLINKLWCFLFSRHHNKCIIIIDVFNIYSYPILMFKFVVTGFCLLFNGWSRATAQKVPGALQECTRSLQGWINYFIDLWLCCMFMTHWHSLLTFIHLESFEGLFQLSCCCKAWYSLFPIQTWTSRKSSASFSACFTGKPYLFHWAEILDLRWIHCLHQLNLTLQLDPQNVDALVALAIMDLQTNEGTCSAQEVTIGMLCFPPCF